MKRARAIFVLTEPEIGSRCLFWRAFYSENRFPLFGMRSSGANLTFESRLRPGSWSNVKFKSSKRFNKLLVVLMIHTFAWAGAARGGKCLNRTTSARRWLFAAIFGAVTANSAVSHATPANAADAERGAEVYRASCAQCHGPARSMQVRIKADTDRDQAWLDAFLSDHYCEDENQRADLIAFLNQE